jgi:hypothetical protein
MPYVRKNKRSKPKRIKALTFEKKVQQVINKNAEDKEAYNAVVNTNFNSAISASTDIVALIPSVIRGTNEGDRDGDEITATQFIIKGHMLSNLTFSDYSSSRICVRMMIVSPKMFSSQSVITSNYSTWLPALLQKGNTTTGFTGLVTDLYAPLNRNVVTVHSDKLHFITAPYVPASNAGDLNTTPQTNTKFFTYSFKVKNKKLKYADDIDSGLTPTNFNPVLLLGYAHLDNSTPDSVNTQINMSWTALLKYQDL